MKSRTDNRVARSAEIVRSSEERFYDDRYEHGYMEAWPEHKKRRIAKLIRSLPLPDRGAALDYGCGTGEFTAVLRAALPVGWTVHGCDISAAALRLASKRLSHSTFFHNDEIGGYAGRFDFVFTHHVLEHVVELPTTIDQIAALQSAKSRMLHVLPCGNSGSFEYRLCKLRRDGIDSARGNRFFFEDEGHLRRLTTHELSELFAPHRFGLTRELYSNQYYGAIDWITSSAPAVVFRLSDVGSAVDDQAEKQLKAFRRRLLALWLARIGAAFVDNRLRRRTRSARDYVLLAAGFAIYPFSKPFDMYIRRLAEQEWRSFHSRQDGSEMYLFFERQGDMESHDDPSFTRGLETQRFFGSTRDP